MKIQFSAKNLDVTSAMRDRTHFKLGKIAKVAGPIASAHVTFELDGHLHRVEMTVHVDHLGHYKARGESEDMYGSLRDAANNIERQAIKDRERRQDRRRKGGKPGEILGAQTMTEEEEEDEGPPRGGVRPLGLAPSEWILSRPMDAEDAILVMEERNWPSVAFKSIGGGGWGVLVRTDDGIRLLKLL